MRGAVPRLILYKSILKYFRNKIISFLRIERFRAGGTLLDFKISIDF